VSPEVGADQAVNSRRSLLRSHAAMLHEASVVISLAAASRCWPVQRASLSNGDGGIHPEYHRRPISGCAFRRLSATSVTDGTSFWRAVRVHLAESDDSCG
jgi:hypothetical protein